MHHWPLNEPSGNAKDTLYGPAGPADGVDTNTVTSAVGPSANIPLARQFTAASSEKFTVSDRNDVEMGIRERGFSISVWVYADAIGALMGIAAKDSGTGGTRSWKLYALATNVFQFAIEDGSNIISGLNSVATISATTWYHVVIVCDHTRYKFYINGVAEPTNSQGSVVPWGNSTAVFQIGQDLAAGAGRFWNGRIAQVTTWHRALTSDEVHWLYNNGRGRDLSRWV